MSESRRDGCISSISSLSMLLIIGIDLRLDVARHLRFIGKLHGFEEVRIDVGEIHLAEVEAREFVDRETGALSFLGLPPRLVDLLPPLLLPDPRQLHIGRASCRERVCLYL